MAYSISLCDLGWLLMGYIEDNGIVSFTLVKKSKGMKVPSLGNPWNRL